MPTYDHLCQSCQHEWEDFYSINAEPPTNCPKCQAATVKRLISLSGKGVVELYGEELMSKLKSDAQQMKKDMHKSANIYANMLGEEHYHKIQTDIDRRKRDKR